MRRINKRRIIYLIIIVVSSIIMMAFSLKTIIDIFRTMDESIVEQEIIRTEKYFYKNLDDIKNFGNLLSLRKDLVIA
jgi:CHASE3 domain sensor protein